MASAGALNPWIFLLVAGLRLPADPARDLLDFQKAVRSAGMTFSLPAGYQGIGRQMEVTGEDSVRLPDGGLQTEQLATGFHLAAKSSSGRVEVGYILWPIDPPHGTPPKADTLDPNDVYKSLLVMNALNFAGAPSCMTSLKGWREPTAQEFGADSVMSAVCRIQKEDALELARPFEYAELIVIHKRSVADAVLCVLFKSKQELQSHLLDSFAALRFR